jgi:hypothetical protein
MLRPYRYIFKSKMHLSLILNYNKVPSTHPTIISHSVEANLVASGTGILPVLIGGYSKGFKVVGFSRTGLTKRLLARTKQLP